MQGKQEADTSKGGFQDPRTRLQAWTAVISGVCVLLFVVIRSILVLVADVTKHVWNIETDTISLEDDYTRRRRWFRTSVLVGTIVTIVFYTCLIVHNLEFVACLNE